MYSIFPNILRSMVCEKNNSKNMACLITRILNSFSGKGTLLLILLAGIFISSETFGQEDSTEIIRPGRIKRLSKNYERAGDIYSAIDYLKRYIDLKPTKYNSYVRLADLYYRSRDYKNAMIWYDKAYQADPQNQILPLYYFSLMQKMTGEPAKAKENFNKFLKENKGGSEEKIYKKKVANEIAGCDIAIAYLDSPLNVIITHLDTSINKAYVELSPILMGDSLIYASLKSDTITYITISDTVKRPVRKLYLARKTNDNWKYQDTLEGPFNNPEYETGNGAYSTDQKRFYFSRCQLNSKNVMICAIYQSNLDSGFWSEPIPLETINESKYTTTQPTVSKDPVKGGDILYFVSDRPEGKGGMDIWYSIFDVKKKIFKAPKNAGKLINTPGDEMTPYYDNDTKTLYFSSDGWPSLGGLDIYKTTGELTKWIGNPQNIGYPINTGVDELYYVLGEKKNSGVFVSNRDGSISLKSPNCCDDIFGFRIKDYVTIIACGTVYSNEDSTTMDADASGTKLLKEGTASLYLIGNDTKEELLVKAVPIKDGVYYFNLEKGNDYKIGIGGKDYFSTSYELSTKKITADDSICRESSIKKIPKGPVVVKNIYYPFDKDILDDPSKANIDTTILKLLNENPEIIAELSSHTDSKGKDDYNMDLSQRRAESVVKYLISKGITKERLIAKGYGETKPIAPNENSDGTDNPDGRQKNRRTEFKVIGSIEKYSEIIYEE